MVPHYGYNPIFHKIPCFPWMVSVVFWEAMAYSFGTKGKLERDQKISIGVHGLEGRLSLAETEYIKRTRMDLRQTRQRGEQEKTCHSVVLH